MRKAGETSAGQMVVQALLAEKVEYVFGLTGTHVMPIFDALIDSPQIRHVVVKHECNAAYMAGMYGFLTGRPGVVIVTAGPGAANSLSGVAQAYACSHPMVHITGDVPRRAGNASFHGVDRSDFLHRLFLDITKWSVRVEEAEQIPAILSKAFAAAASGRPGPVHVDIPFDVLRASLEARPAYRVTPVERRPPEGAQLAALRAALGEARRPVICAGRGVLLARAEAQLAELADLLSAPVVCSVYGQGALPDDHPLYVGFFDEWRSDPLAWELIAEADLLLALGMRTDTRMTRHLAKIMPERTFFAALDEAHTLTPLQGARETFACDVSLLLAALLVESASLRRPADEDLMARIQDHKQNYHRNLEALLSGFESAEALSFGLVVRELALRMEKDAMVVAGVGDHMFWGQVSAPVRGRESFMAEGSWGTMGSEVGGGLAAKLVHPERQVVVITGDGSLLMAAGELVTAVEQGAGVLFVVLNDSRYGIITLLQERDYGRSFGDQIGAVDFARMAESFGASGLRVESPSQVPAAVERALALSASGPVVLDAVCSHEFGRPDRLALLGAG